MRCKGKKTLNEGKNSLVQYCLFRQARYDQIRQIVDGYELLLRKRITNQWQVPVDFNRLTPEAFANVVSEALVHLSPTTKVMINLDHDQFIQPAMLQALAHVQQQFAQQQLIIELTERDNGQLILESELVTAARYLIAQGLQLSLDDVGSGINQFTRLKALLPLAIEVKFALQNGDINDPIYYEQLLFWRQLAQSGNKAFVLEGIETARDVALADQLAITLRQGYYYACPQQFY
ncbi:EAL domain-containing protein [Loigolactobacillus binensis]|uniref:EAL domain-containing protein n=1 Tax=Loigolactobacillus binensis TaxID=2559922 RepID=UPI0036DA3BB9